MHERQTPSVMRLERHRVKKHLRVHEQRAVKGSGHPGARSRQGASQVVWDATGTVSMVRRDGCSKRQGQNNEDLRHASSQDAQCPYGTLSRDIVPVISGSRARHHRGDGSQGSLANQAVT